MKRLVALCEVYHNRTYYPGDTFEASEQDAMILIAIGRARAEDLPPVPKAEPLQTRALRAEPQAEDDPPSEVQQPMNTQDTAALVPPPARTRGKYKRRDMRSED